MDRQMPRYHHVAHAVEWWAKISKGTTHHASRDENGIARKPCRLEYRDAWGQSPAADYGTWKIAKCQPAKYVPSAVTG